MAEHRRVERRSGRPAEGKELFTVNSNQFRQGDVFIESADSLPEGLEPLPREGGRIILALGESTGHAHAIAERNATLFGRPGSDERWLVIRASGTRIEAGSGATVRHEEHAPIVLKPGVYRVARQREYSPVAIHNVAD